jgi:hypothetical protein
LWDSERAAENQASAVGGKSEDNGSKETFPNVLEEEVEPSAELAEKFGRESNAVVSSKLVDAGLELSIRGSSVQAHETVHKISK